MISSRLWDFTGEEVWDRPHETVECRRALSPSGLPGIDYALNPYGGCEHGCVYCYAPELTHSEWDSWRVVRVRTNIASRLSKELPNIEGVIGIGTTTDPYQPAESRFRLTRSCLGRIRERGARIHMHTKSGMVLRDLDILKDLEGDVAVTITTVDERISKRIEPGAPLPEERLDALERLTEEGLRTYALVGPVLDVLEGKEREFVDAVAATGTERMFVDRLNQRPLLSVRMERAGIRGSDLALERIRALATDVGMEVRDVFGRSRPVP